MWRPNDVVASPMLKVENASKQFPGVPALRYVSLEFNPGRFHALVRKDERIRDLCFSGISVFSIPTIWKRFFGSPMTLLFCGTAALGEEEAE